MSLPAKPVHDPLRAQILLLKAIIQRKASLLYQINQIKIKNTYRQSNSDFKDYKDLASISKALKKRLNEVKFIRSTSKDCSMKKLSSETVEALSMALNNSAEKINDIGDALGQDVGNEDYVAGLKDRYEYLNEIYQAKLKEFNNNEEFLGYNSEQVEIFTGLDEEVNRFRGELNLIMEENRDMESKKAKLAASRVSYIDRVKFFQQLTEDALKLRSKLLLREELTRNLRSAEVELELLTKKIYNEKARLANMEEKKMIYSNL
jgi:hypothetical protein